MREAAAEGYITATALADVLVEAGVPFRSAHHVVGALVRRAETAGLHLDESPDQVFADVLAASGDPMAAALAGDPAIAHRLRAAATIEGALARFDVDGGTAPERVRMELERAAERLGLAAGDQG
jgi:argininosuccinate lyase